jgi:hypothetical protein
VSAPVLHPVSAPGLLGLEPRPGLEVEWRPVDSPSHWQSQVQQQQQQIHCLSDDDEVA